MSAQTKMILCLNIWHAKKRNAKQHLFQKLITYKKKLHEGTFRLYKQYCSRLSFLGQICSFHMKMARNILVRVVINGLNEHSLYSSLWVDTNERRDEKRDITKEKTQMLEFKKIF